MTFCFIKIFVVFKNKTTKKISTNMPNIYKYIFPKGKIKKINRAQIVSNLLHVSRMHVNPFVFLFLSFRVSERVRV